MNGNGKGKGPMDNPNEQATKNANIMAAVHGLSQSVEERTGLIADRADAVRLELKTHRNAFTAIAGEIDNARRQDATATMNRLALIESAIVGLNDRVIELRNIVDVIAAHVVPQE